ncbi:hypothetical protein DUNSADRAFT_3017 [Dunaliella salina]|uniref:Nuclear pore complex protein NUP96 C-terminal domain-containing protein n=1 Tax=Dunaliella salina TaxID=3046 RepID=A0ABQ7GUQ9_DUNSA|nr:hypothetical protein DUNSADRAFT_3017 [Dunaliella salina]|eukprot:KAF5838346.1 hypothetical protein DUNSADRAFT_3017 [Dunaliella salina]
MVTQDRVLAGVIGGSPGFLSGSPPSPQPEGAPSFSHPQQPQQQQPPIGGPSSNTHPAPASSSALPLPLLPPMSAVGLGAQDPGLVEGLWGQSLMGSRAAPAWAKLRALLATYAGTSGLGSALRCSAAAAILREDPRMHLPPWLLDMFQGAQKETGGSYEGMASAGCGPAELLDIYMAADRLEDAVAVVAEHVSRWSNTDPRLRRGRLAAAWFPHRRIRALRQRLRAAGADTSALDSAMAHHLEVLEHDAPVAQLPGPSGSNAGQLGLFGAPFEPAISFH